MKKKPCWVAIAMLELFLSFYCTGALYANESISQETTGDQSPAIAAGGNVTVSYGLSADEVLKLRETIKVSEANIVAYIASVINETHSKDKDAILRISNQKIFEDFVKPIHINFEAVHKDYLETFKNYRHVLKTSDKPFNLIHPVWDLIQEDHIFSDGSREKLKVMTQRFKSYRYKFRSEYEVRDGTSIEGAPSYIARGWVRGGNLAQVKESPTMDYIARIIFYLTTPRSMLEIDKGGIANPYEGNVPRYELFNELERILAFEGTDKNKKKEAISAIDHIVMDLQKQYKAIVNDYMRCKEMLLS